MTLPHPGDIGRAEIEVGADTSHFPGEAKRGVEAALSDVDPSFKKAGEDWGDTASTSLGERMKSRVPEIVNKAISEINRTKIKEKIKIEPDYDKDEVRKVTHGIAQTIENELANGGIGSALTSVIGDAVGAAFNVSGKSPLIYLLIPTFGALGAAITALVGLVYALGAALLTLPAIIGSLLLQFGALYLIFKDIGAIATKAFAAQNIYELAAAFKGVDPYIQNFILELIYIRDAFKGITGYLSVEFFKTLGNTLLDIFDINRYTLFKGLYDLSGQLGTFFATIGKAFEGPEWLKLLGDLFKITKDFLVENGPAVKNFLLGLFKFVDSLTDDAGRIGHLFNTFLTFLGGFLDKLATNKDFQDFMAKLPDMLAAGSGALGAFFDLILAILNSLSQEEWIQFFNAFAFLIELLADFFKSDVGQESMKTFIEILLGLTFVFEILVGAIGDVLAAIGWLADGITWIGDHFTELIHKFMNGRDFLASVGQAFLTVRDNIVGAFTTLIHDAPGWGVKVVQGFIDGALSKIPGVKDAFHFIAEAAAAFMPHSPAKAGPLSGSGAPQARGAAMIRDFSKGILDNVNQVSNATTTAMNNVNFGTGAVIANFYGAQPTGDQARMLGTAVGNGIGDQLLARNARLAVRTM